MSYFGEISCLLMNIPTYVFDIYKIMLLEIRDLFKINFWDIFIKLICQ